MTLNISWFIVFWTFDIMLFSPRWLTPAWQIGILEAGLLKNGFEKAIFKKSCLQRTLLRDYASSRVINVKSPIVLLRVKKNLIFCLVAFGDSVRVFFGDRLLRFLFGENHNNLSPNPLTLSELRSSEGQLKRSFFSLKSLILICASPLLGTAQSTVLTIQDITIEGNKRTKEKVILRELEFQKGDTITLDEWTVIKERNEELVMNTGLFTEVVLSLTQTGEKGAAISTQVREFWYIFPLVLFRLADRNFSIWWSEQNRSLDRVNYGMRFFHHNLTGRRDRLRLITQLGYLKVLELAYDLPMVGNNENLGVFGDIHFSNQKEVAYITQGSRLQFFKEAEEPILLKRFRVGAGSTYRDGIFKYHTAKIFYSSNWIGTPIAELNPEYFLKGLNRQQHFTFQYDFTIDRRDVKVYPIKGDQLSLFVQKDGFGFSHEDINVLSTRLSYARFFPIGKKQIHSFGAKITGRYTFNRSEQPYTHTSFVGYIPNALKGYEFYVMDGLDAALLKTHFRLRLFQKDIQWGKWVFLEQFRFMPLSVYFTINNDVGYVNAPFSGDESTLSNQWLWGRGIGLDILFYYNRLLRFEYSFNHLGERGLFFSWDLAF